MSIIHDALKKVQTKTNIPDYNTTKPCSKKNRPQQVFLILTVLASITGIPALLYYISPAVNAPLAPRTYPNINKVQHKSTLKTYPDQNSRQKFKRSRSRLFLNGTMVIDDKKAALINNEIYKIGDIIDGKKIVNITMEGVELLDGDKIILLKHNSN